MIDENLYFRQIHPSHFQNGVVSSEAFRPTEEHKWLLSLYDGKLTEPEASWNHFTKDGMNESVGVMALDSSQCSAVGVVVISSPEIFPEHCHIDFTPLSKGARKNTARKLRDKALERGFVFVAPAQLE